MTTKALERVKIRAQRDRLDLLEERLNGREAKLNEREKRSARNEDRFNRLRQTTAILFQATHQVANGSVPEAADQVCAAFSMLAEEFLSVPNGTMLVMMTAKDRQDLSELRRIVRVAVDEVAKDDEV